MHAYNLRPRLHPVRYFPERPRRGSEPLLWTVYMLGAYFLLLALFQLATHFRWLHD